MPLLAPLDDDTLIPGRYMSRLMHINSIQYRRRPDETRPRRIKNIVTCPTTMSEIERRNPLQFGQRGEPAISQVSSTLEHRIEVVPAPQRTIDTPKWYYDRKSLLPTGLYLWGDRP